MAQLVKVERPTGRTTLTSWAITQEKMAAGRVLPHRKFRLDLELLHRSTLTPWSSVTQADRGVVMSAGMSVADSGAGAGGLPSWRAKPAGSGAERPPGAAVRRVSGALTQ